MAVWNINENLDSCKWYTNRFLKNAKDCRFRVRDEGVHDTSLGKIPTVFLPKGTKLYRKASGMNKWWEKQFPSNIVSGGVWFTSTEEHAGWLPGTIVLEYQLKKEIVLYFIQNLNKFGLGGGKMTGNDFIQTYGKFLFENSEVKGYMGCNECEIFVLDEDIPSAFHKIPRVISDIGLKFID